MKIDNVFYGELHDLKTAVDAAVKQFRAGGKSKPICMAAYKLAGKIRSKCAVYHPRITCLFNCKRIPESGLPDIYTAMRQYDSAIERIVYGYDLFTKNRDIQEKLDFIEVLSRSAYRYSKTREMMDAPI
jgi:hypothetical protein